MSNPYKVVQDGVEVLKVPGCVDHYTSVVESWLVIN